MEEGGRALSNAWRLGRPGCSLGCVMGQETRPVGSAPWGLSGQRGGGGGGLLEHRAGPTPPSSRDRGRKRGGRGAADLHPTAGGETQEVQPGH